MDAIIPLLVFVMVFIVARKWVHGEEGADEMPQHDERQSREGLPHGVRSR